MMIVSMIQVYIEIQGLNSIKEKRMIVKSLKDKLIHKFQLSAAEIDDQDSLRFIRIGAAFVSNSKTFGESVLQKVFRFIEENAEGRILDSSIHSEKY